MDGSRESTAAKTADLVDPADAIEVGSQLYMSPELVALAIQAAELEKGDVEDSTRRTYRYVLRDYENFCGSHELDAFAALSVRLYVANRVSVQEPKATLRTRIAAIRRMALDAGRPDPTSDPFVEATIRGATRMLPIREPKRATPATYETLEPLAGATAVLAALRRDSKKLTNQSALALQLRDRALLLLGFAIGRRGAELARIDCEHIDRRADGLLIKIPWSKTNKSGEPEYVGVPAFPEDPLCPVAALGEWLAFSKIEHGPVFLTLSPVTGRGGNRMRGVDISRRLEMIAAEANLPGFWRSHSLRRGVVTSAETHGVARSRTRTLTGWKSDAMFAVYADHTEKIAASPLHEIYGNRSRR